MENLYNNLGVASNATPEEIKKAHRKGVKENHPDKGGNPDKFALIQKAYEVLSDEDKRKRYDETGETDEPKDEFHTRFADFMDNVVVSIMESKNNFYTDPIKEGLQVLSNTQMDFESKIPKCEKKIKKIEDNIERVNYLGKDNLLVSLLKEKIKVYKTEINNCNKGIEFCIKATEELSKYNYKVDEQPKNSWDLDSINYTNL